MDENKLQQFLNTIAQLESSGGKNINHPVITNGVNEGTRAIGKYGLTEGTIQEQLNRMHNSGEGSDELENLRGSNSVDLKQALLQNPDLQEQIAKSLAQRVLENQNGNELAAAYAWNHGTNLLPNRIPSKALLTDPYTSKFSKEQSNQNINNLAKKKALERYLADFSSKKMQS